MRSTYLNCTNLLCFKCRYTDAHCKGYFKIDGCFPAFRGGSARRLFPFIQKFLYFVEIPVPIYIEIKSQKLVRKSFVCTKQAICVVIHILVKLFHKGITDVDATDGLFKILFLVQNVFSFTL